MSGGTGDGGLVAGHRIGKYQVLKRLTAGGMAELFLARTVGIEGFQKVVALKRILPHLADNEEFVDMFLHEARLAATLEHPNIVHVSDIGKAGNDYFFVMAYVHGEDLLSVLRAAHKQGHRLSLGHCLTIALGLCAGLHYAHEHVGFDGKPLGIVHRDVSPTNILISYDGNVKVVDFGIAKAAAQNAITRAGVRKGKASYMSPEQCKGLNVDRRSDIWSIGVVLWEITMMSRLFVADNELAIMHKIVSEPIPELLDMDPDYPAELAAIVSRCLRLDPEERYSSVRELQRDLERFAATLPEAPSATALGELMRTLFGEPEVPWMGVELSFEAGAGGTQAVDYANLPTPVRTLPSVEPLPAFGSGSQSEMMMQPPPGSWSQTHASGSMMASVPSSSRMLWIGGGGLIGTNLAVLVWWLGSSLLSPGPVDPSAPPPTSVVTTAEPGAR